MACKYIYKGTTYSSKEEFINKVIPTLQNSTLSKFDKVPTNKQVYNASIKNYEDNIVNFEKAIQAIKDNNYKIILPNNTGRYVASVESEGIRGGTIPIAENPYTKEAKEGKFDKEYALSYLKERIEIEKGSIENENRKIKDIEKVENDVYNKNINSNNFLQLLNKDNNWITFFIKSIIQDTAKQTITEVQESDVEAKVRELEKEGLLEIDCKGKLKAEKGLATSFVKGGKWKVIKDLKGYPTHKEGGVDLTIGKGGVSIKNGNTQFTAKYGLVIPKN